MRVVISWSHERLKSKVTAIFAYIVVCWNNDRKSSEDWPLPDVHLAQHSNNPACTNRPTRDAIAPCPLHAKVLSSATMARQQTSCSFSSPTLKWTLFRKLYSSQGTASNSLPLRLSRTKANANFQPWTVYTQLRLCVNSTAHTEAALAFLTTNRPASTLKGRLSHTRLSTSRSIKPQCCYLCVRIDQV